MSHLVPPVDKLNVFSFAAGFFFLTAAALSAYLIYQEEEETMSLSAVNANSSKADVKASDLDRAKESTPLEAEEEGEDTSAQEEEDEEEEEDTDFLALDNTAESDNYEIESEKGHDSTPAKCLPAKVPRAVGKCFQVEDVTCDSSEDSESSSEEEDDEGESNPDEEEGSSSMDATADILSPQSKKIGGRCDRNSISPIIVRERVPKARDASPLGGNLLLMDNSPDLLSEELPLPEEDVDGTKAPAMVLAIKEPTGFGGLRRQDGRNTYERGDHEDGPRRYVNMDSGSNDYKQSDITKLYKMEEDVKISRYNSPSQDETDDQSTSYLHYSKVTTIGVYGPSQEKDDLEELLKNRTFQGSYSEWAHPNCFTEEFFEETKVQEGKSGDPPADAREEGAQPGAEFDLTKARAAQVERLEDQRKPVPSLETSQLGQIDYDKVDLDALSTKTPSASLSMREPDKTGLTDTFDNLFPETLSPSADLSTKSQTEKQATSDRKGKTKKDSTAVTIAREDGGVSADTGKREPLLFSKYSSPSLTQWYAWEKDILGDTFVMDSADPSTSLPVATERDGLEKPRASTDESRVDTVHGQVQGVTKDSKGPSFTFSQPREESNGPLPEQKGDQASRTGDGPREKRALKKSLEKTKAQENKKSAKDSPVAGRSRPWCNKRFEPKTPSDLESALSGSTKKRTEKILQKNKYVSPYTHPARKPLNCET